TLVFVAIFIFRGLYPAVGLGAVEALRRLVINTSIGFLSILTFTFALHTTAEFSRFSFMLCWMLALLLVPLGRGLTRIACVRLGVWGQPVVIVGDRVKAAELAAFLRSQPKIGL